MKSIILVVLVVAFNSGYSQNHSIITTDYLAIKDALVASKQNEASVAAEKLLSSLQKESMGFDTGAMKIWNEKKKILVKEGETIAKSKDLEKQRVAFANLSPAFWELVKVSKSTEKLFYNYCPMKKSYWISAEEKIKNPFYGSQMLTCGKVAEKIN